MNKKTFWEIMLETNKESGGEPMVQQELIEVKLNELPADEIIEFDKIYRQLENDAYDWKLWAAAYIINGGCADDCFMDFRGWLVAQGEEIYTKALADPDSLAELDNLDGDVEWEGFGYLAFNAYEKKTGKELPISPEIIYPAEPKGDNWDEDELDTLLPKLSKKTTW